MIRWDAVFGATPGHISCTKLHYENKLHLWIQRIAYEAASSGIIRCLLILWQNAII